MAIPANTVLPAITGTVTVGLVLSLSNGTWDNVPTAYVYAWLRDGVVIDSEVSNTYTLTLDDIAAVITGSVTASNVDGSAVAISAGTTAVPSTLIVEDGTVVANADTYMSLDEATTYHIGRGNAAWLIISQGDKEASLRNATTYMIENYRFTWNGLRKDVAQTLDWPRIDVFLDPAISGENGVYPYEVSNVIVPEEVKMACGALSLRASTADLYPDQSQVIIREKIGPLETEFSEFSPTKVRYSSIDAMLRPYLANNGARQLQVVRS
tara:strand:+ start:18602 stop:19402 length:801 start_codon:yes stop_codon:yes gene_type:complete